MDGLTICVSLITELMEVVRIQLVGFVADFAEICLYPT